MNALADFLLNIYKQQGTKTGSRKQQAKHTGQIHRNAAILSFACEARTSQLSVVVTESWNQN